MEQDKTHRLAVGLLLVLSFGWGVNWPVMKTALLELPLWQLRTVTCVVAAGILLGLAWAMRTPIALPRRMWLPMSLAAFCNVTLWHVLVAYAVLLMASGHAAVLGFTMPLWTTLIGITFLGERLTARRALALALGIGGVLVLLSRDLTGIYESPLGAVLVLGAAFAWAAGTIVQKRTPWPFNSVAFAGWQLLVGAIPMAVIAVSTERFAAWGEASTEAWLATAYITLIALSFCYYAWARIVTLLPPSVAGLGTLLVPVIGLFSGAVLLSEPLGWREILAVALICAALALVLLRPQASMPPAPEPAE